MPCVRYGRPWSYETSSKVAPFVEGDPTALDRRRWEAVETTTRPDR
jgi:hypothetical protein